MAKTLIKKKHSLIILTLKINNYLLYHMKKKIFLKFNIKLYYIKKF